MKPELKVKDVGIMLVGGFNPVIFHPEWLAKKKLIRDGEAAAVADPINSREISQFALDLGEIQVLLDKFTIYSKAEQYFEPLKDLTLGIFGFLQETPIYKMGINFTSHFQFNNKEAWHEYGHLILPKEALWQNIVKNPGLNQVMVSSEREDEYKGMVITITGISEVVPPSKFGIRITVNDHYDFDVDRAKEEIDATSMLEILQNNWNNSRQQADKIINSIIAYYDEQTS